MKKLLISCWIILFSWCAFSSETERVMGELTGAGRAVDIKNLKGLIHPTGIFEREEIQKIAFKNNVRPEAAKVSDIDRVMVDNQSISAKEFIGIVIQK